MRLSLGPSGISRRLTQAQFEEAVQAAGLTLAEADPVAFALAEADPPRLSIDGEYLTSPIDGQVLTSPIDGQYLLGAR